MYLVIEVEKIVLKHFMKLRILWVLLGGILEAVQVLLETPSSDRRRPVAW